MGEDYEHAARMRDMINAHITWLEVRRDTIILEI